MIAEEAGGQGHFRFRVQRYQIAPVAVIRASVIAAESNPLHLNTDRFLKVTPLDDKPKSYMGASLGLGTRQPSICSCSWEIAYSLQRLFQ